MDIIVDAIGNIHTLIGSSEGGGDTATWQKVAEIQNQTRKLLPPDRSSSLLDRALMHAFYNIHAYGLLLLEEIRPKDIGWVKKDTMVRIDQLYGMMGEGIDNLTFHAWIGKFIPQVYTTLELGEVDMSGFRGERLRWLDICVAELITNYKKYGVDGGLFFKTEVGKDGKPYLIVICTNTIKKLEHKPYSTNEGMKILQAALTLLEGSYEVSKVADSYSVILRVPI